MFSAAFYWFELFMMFHKLVLISVLPSFVGEDGVSFIIISFLIEFVNVILTAALKPFADPALDQLNMNTLVITCFVLFYAIVRRLCSAHTAHARTAHPRAYACMHAARSSQTPPRATVTSRSSVSSLS